MANGPTMNIEEAPSLKDIPNLLVFMHMPARRRVERKTRMLGRKMDVLGIKYLKHLLVLIAESVFGDAHDLYGLVVTLAGDGVNLGVVASGGDGDGDVPEEDADRSEGGVADGYPRVMGEGLISWEVVKVVGTHVQVVLETME